MSFDLSTDHFCFDDCMYLDLTEKQQREIIKFTGIIRSHMCNLTNERLYHRDKHPLLYAAKGCEYKKLEAKG